MAVTTARRSVFHRAWWFPATLHGQSDYLRRAAEEGDVQWVQKILKGRTPADPKEPSHTSALQMAAQGGHLEIVKALLASGAEINRVADGTALIDAAAGGHTDTLKYLLEHKADPAVTWNGDSAMHMAARYGHPACVQLLLAQDGAKQALAQRNDEGKTPLAMACCQAGKGNVECVKLLMAAGADSSTTDKAGQTLVHKAAIVGDQAMLSVLLDAGCAKALRATDVNGRTPLHLAAQFGRADAVALLMHTQPDVASKDKDGCTALHSIVRSVMCDQATKVKLAKMMLNAGADPAVKDKDGRAAEDYLPQAFSSRASPAPAGPSQPVNPVLRAIKAVPGAASAAQIDPSPMARDGANASKSAKIAQALRDGLAAAGGDEAAVDREEWVLKQAMRGPSVEETATWKIGASHDGKD